MKFWLVDAFTSQPFAGNPAGVCVVGEFPSDSTMQKIAGELHWSQTAFVKPIADHHFHIRWFSPKDEAPICGHATLASAHILWKKQHTASDTIWFESLAGPLVAKRGEDEAITLDFPSKPIVECTLSNHMRDVLGDVRVEAAYRDSLIEVVVLADASELMSLTPRLDLLQKLPCRALSVTAPGPDGYDFCSRYFAPKVGIPEDPVCGSSHCRLAPYWADRLGKNYLKAYQASPRSGVVHCHVRESRVDLTGHAVIVCEGFFPNYQLELGSQ